jgi:hypothetical protein
MALVVTGGNVSIVVCTVREYPVEVDSPPFSSVITVTVCHATSNNVVYGSNDIVVGVDNVSGGNIKLQGGIQLIVGHSSE